MLRALTARVERHAPLVREVRLVAHQQERNVLVVFDAEDLFSGVQHLRGIIPYLLTLHKQVKQTVKRAPSVRHFLTVYLKMVYKQNILLLKTLPGIKRDMYRRQQVKLLIKFSVKLSLPYLLLVTLNLNALVINFKIY